MTTECAHKRTKRIDRTSIGCLDCGVWLADDIETRAREIAEDVTNYQRSILDGHIQRPFAMSRWDAECQRMCDRGLLGIGPRGGYMPTELGRAVAAILAEKPTI